MIVEDEHGNEIDLAELDDDREPEPPDPENEPPVDLGVLKDIHARYLAEGASAEGKEAAQILLEYMPALIVELKDARARLHELNSWDHHNEYVFVRPGEDPAQPPAIVPRVYASPQMVAEYHANPDDHPVGGVPWVRTVSASPWEQHTEPPF